MFVYSFFESFFFDQKTNQYLFEDKDNILFVKKILIIMINNLSRMNDVFGNYTFKCYAGLILCAYII